jgi:hypothetical protein
MKMQLLSQPITIVAFYPKLMCVLYGQVSWLTPCCRPSHPEESGQWHLESATLFSAYSSGNCSGIAPVFPFNQVHHE